MPNIKSFDTPALGLHPTETGIDTVAGNARRLGSFYNEQAGSLEQLAGQEGQAYRSAGNAVGGGIAAAGAAYVNYEDHKEISHGAAAGTQGVAGLENSLNDTVSHANPNDGSVGAKFMETQFEPWAENFKAAFTTEKSQEFAEGFVDRYRQHFTTKVAADMSTMAGIAAKQNAKETINNLSGAAYRDPSSLDTNLDILRHSAGHIVDSSPTMDAETGARVKSELNQTGGEAVFKSAVIGYVEKAGKLPPWVNDPKYAGLANGPELKMFEKQAQVQARSDAATARQDLLQKKQLADQNMHAGSNQILTDNVSIDPQSGQPVINPKFFQQTLDLARKNPDAPSAASTVRTMLDWGESQQNKEKKAVDDPTTVKGLTDKLFDPSNPTTQIDLMRAQTQGKLSDHTFTQLGGMVKQLQETPLKGPIYQDTMKAAHGTLVLNVPGIPGKDDKGEQNYASFVQNFIPQYLSQFRAGTLPPNALDIKDPNSMISQSMKQFVRSPQQRMQDYVSSLGGLVPGIDVSSTEAPKASAAPTVTTKEQFDALASGATYVGKDGKSYWKP